ncbi:MAG: glycosyltransferase [Pirellulaceae bacterium]|nr:glycosyltransferase [Pirellulaceae bacterium]
MNPPQPSSPEQAIALRSGRLIVIDCNLTSPSDPAFEFASLIASGAKQLGLRPGLATHASFTKRAKLSPPVPLARAFHVRRLSRWSLRADGESKSSRDLSGKPVGGTGFQNTWARMAEKMVAAVDRPEAMLQHWSQDFLRLLAALKPTSRDTLLLNDADDFTMLALAAAMKKADLPFALRIDLVFHQPIYHPLQGVPKQRESNLADRVEQLKQFGHQVNHCFYLLRPHAVRLFATSNALASQMQESDLQQRVTPIPYPTRARTIGAGGKPDTAKILLAGSNESPRRQQAITEVLQMIEGHLKSKHCSLSMKPIVQQQELGWTDVVPRPLQSIYQQGLHHAPGNVIEVVGSKMPTAAYHEWLDSADVGLFLHDPVQNAVHCNTVLLELMVRGVPVIVPDQCWMADQVRIAGGHRSVGFIYQNRQEIAGLLRQASRHREALRQRAKQHAKVVANLHSPSHVLRAMGHPGSNAISGDRVA